MTIDSRVGRGPLVSLFAVGLSFGISCTDDEGSPDAQTGDTEMVTTTTGEPGPATSEAGSSEDGADSSSGGGEDSSGSTGEAIDPNLDRSAPNILDDPSLCGYPGPGPGGYGGFIDQQRFPNFVLEDCGGNQREFAEFFCRREDEYEDFNHAFIVVFEAVW